MDTWTSPGPSPGEFDGELSDDLRARIKSELDPGERVVWFAQPVFKPQPIGLAAVFWTVFAALLGIVSVACFRSYFLGGEARGEGPRLAQGTVALSFATVIWLILLSGRGRRRRIRAGLSGTLYALTLRRAIIWKPGERPGSVVVYSVPRGKVVNVHRVEFPDGSGDVNFMFDGRWSTYDYQFPRGFEGVADVRRVEEQVRRVLIDPDAATV